MTITAHACQRFIERVIGEKDTKELRKRASHWLSQEIGDSELPDGVYSLPSFDGFVFIVEDKHIVTIRKKKPNGKEKNARIYI